MVIELFAIFFIPLLLTLFFTPFVIKLAENVGAMDMPNERKVHRNPTPRLGGVAIYMSFFISAIICLQLFPSTALLSSATSERMIMLVASLTLVLFLGIWDDIKQLTPGKKFLIQLVAATLIYFAGFHVSFITSPANLGLLNLGFFDFPATILWIVFITNAFNLIDGLDGLASGVAFIVSITISAVSFLKGDVATATLTLMLAGTVLGFLRYNFNRAKIFLGDSGSLFIGFSIAILSMHSSTKGSTAFSLLVPMLALGLPIVDTTLSMIRRFLRSILQSQGEQKSFFKKIVTMFHPDSGHIHHQLISLGLSHKKVVILMYLISLLFGLGAFAVTITNTFDAIWIFVIIGMATMIGISRLRYKEMAFFRNGILLPLYERPLINNTFFLVFLDIAFIIIAHSVASFLTTNRQEYAVFNKLFFNRLMLICGIRFLVFYLGGLYDWNFRQWGLGNVLRTMKVVGISVGITLLIFAIVPNLRSNLIAARSVIDFYILVSLVMGMRISYHILNYISRQARSGKKNVLIYGANSKGLLVAQEIMGTKNLEFCPIGFLDEDPILEGKKLDGYPIFGGHRKLSRLINKLGVSEVILVDQIKQPVVMARIQSIIRDSGITVRRANLKFETVSVHEKKSQKSTQEYSFMDK
jgi:UDP-GlcNAc:undecaprenyl-phosphate/decaprenyl-phosphate GlcNAc-1-phosphate transferase